MGADLGRDHLTRRGRFTNRVYWAQRRSGTGTALPLFLIRADEDRLLGAITLDNIRRGPAQAGTLGYWIGAPYARQGYMTEAIRAWCIMPSRKWTCQPDREPPVCRKTSRRAACLKAAGFKYEGVAQSYLQIDGRWRNHVLYANLRSDRRGRAPTPAEQAGARRPIIRTRQDEGAQDSTGVKPTNRIVT